MPGDWIDIKDGARLNDLISSGVGSRPAINLYCAEKERSNVQTALNELVTKQEWESCHYNMNIGILKTAILGGNESTLSTLLPYYTERALESSLVYARQLQLPLGEKMILERLDALKHQNIARLEQAINALEALRFGELDTQMNEFIQEQQVALKEIENDYDETRCIKLLSDLEICLNVLQAPIFIEARRAADAFRSNTSRWARGVQAKADRIELAVANIPVQERIVISKDNMQKIADAMASKRYGVGKIDNSQSC